MDSNTSMQNQSTVQSQSNIQNPYQQQAGYYMSDSDDPTPEQKATMRTRFSILAPISAIYALFYAFCLYKNTAGITYPFFATGSLLFFFLCMKMLGISVKKDSIFLVASIILLGVSTCLTGDGRIIFFNKLGLLLLLMCFLIHQFCKDTKWDFGKYLGSIFLSCFGAIGKMAQPFKDGNEYRKEKEGFGKGMYVVLGLCITIPLVMVVLFLLMSADLVFENMIDGFLENINLGDIFGVFFLVVAVFFFAYGLMVWFLEKNLSDEVKDKRNGEPILAITVTSVLTLVYLLFCGIQIFSLFLGNMELPVGYTYAEYARRGYFELLTVVILNCILVLVGMKRFRESFILKAILTTMSCCTYIMIASSAMRMVLYIQKYHLTFLRVLVLWSLAVLTLLLTGLIIQIYNENFKLFRYCMVVVTVFYLILSFAHPDYWIAKYNVAHKNEMYTDFYYLSRLSADAAPVMAKTFGKVDETRHQYERNLENEIEGMDWRTFNVSVYVAKKELE